MVAKARPSHATSCQGCKQRHSSHHSPERWGNCAFHHPKQQPVFIFGAEAGNVGYPSVPERRSSPPTPIGPPEASTNTQINRSINKNACNREEDLAKLCAGEPQSPQRTQPGITMHRVSAPRGAGGGGRRQGSGGRRRRGGWCLGRCTSPKPCPDSGGLGHSREEMRAQGSDPCFPDAGRG